MSKTEFVNLVSPTAQDSTLNQLQELQAALREKKQLLKQATKDSEFYTKYGQVVPGSVRAPTTEDLAILGHAHGKVCDIKCEACSTVRVINVQDAFQVKYCKDCRSEVKKADGKAKRLAKSTSPEKLKAKMAELEAQLAIYNAA